MRQLGAIVLRMGLWGFALLLGGLTGAGFVKWTESFGATTGAQALALVAGGFVISGFVAVCVMSAVEQVFPVFRATRPRRSGVVARTR